MVVFDNHEFLTAEEKRLKEDRHRTKYWKKWGSYLSERQWATGWSYATSRQRVEQHADTVPPQCGRTIVTMVTPGIVSITHLPQSWPSSPEAPPPPATSKSGVPGSRVQLALQQD